MEQTVSATPEHKAPLNIERIAQRFVDDIRNDLDNDSLVWPSVPAVILQIRKVIKDPETSLADIAEAIAMDPALATRILRFANSAIFGSVRSCNDLREAVVRLGSTTLEHAVMLFVVGQVFNVGKRRQIQPHLARLWRHSTSVASICEQLSKTQDHLKPEVAMLAGLIHDIGVLPILVRAEKVPKLLVKTQIIDRLLEVLHTDVGRRMLDAWELPVELVNAASDHENETREPTGALDYTDLVIAANVLSRAGQPHRLGGLEYESLPVFKHLNLDAEALAKLLADAKLTEHTLRQ